MIGWLTGYTELTILSLMLGLRIYTIDNRKDENNGRNDKAKSDGDL